MADNCCKWVVREGTNNTFWAFTPCKNGFNYLSRVHKAEHIKTAYNGRICPICGKLIKCNTALVENRDYV